MKLTWLVAVVVGSFAIGGCAATDAASDGVSEDADVALDTHTTSLHGTWTDDHGTARPASVDIEQSALSARLVVKLDGHVCLAESVVEAKVTTDGVKTDADVAGMHLVIDGKPDLDTLKANFGAIAGGPCPGQGGWMAVHR